MSIIILVYTVFWGIPRSPILQVQQLQTQQLQAQAQTFQDIWQGFQDVECYRLWIPKARLQEFSSLKSDH